MPSLRYNVTRISAVLANPPDSLLDMAQVIDRAAALRTESAILKSEYARLTEEIKGIDQALANNVAQWKRCSDRMSQGAKELFLARLNGMKDDGMKKRARLTEIESRRKELKEEHDSLVLPDNSKMVLSLLFELANGHNGSSANGRVNRHRVDDLLYGIGNGAYVEDRLSNLLVRTIRAVSPIPSEKLQESLTSLELSTLLFFLCVYQRN